MAVWTNESVREFSKGREPVSAILDHAQNVVFDAIQSGWSGPPYDPIALADHLKISIVPSADVKDARTVPAGSGRRGLRIEFNPNRPRGRMRYSIAHEIAHTFFPDCADRVRHRSHHTAGAGDEWQLETLCNIAAAEILMPIAPIKEDMGEDTRVEDVLQLSRKYDVSVEAILIRVCHLSQNPMVVFVASKHTHGIRAPYKMDYAIRSPAWHDPLSAGFKLPSTSAVAECTAIGFTAKSREKWPGIPNPVEAEYVGLPAHLGHSEPRVAGLAKLSARRKLRPATLEYLRGDALSPRGEGPRLIAHIVNDKTPNWGGNGFAAAVKRQYPDVQQDFKEWIELDRDHLKLGEIHVAHVAENIQSVQMIAQAGYGVSTKPRIRYLALQKCLDSVAAIATTSQATVHMPRIGMGHARGQWPVIEDLIYESLISRGVATTVYDLPAHPGSADEWQIQSTLEFE